ncbi:GNAT family N-acetyltransferase [Magnetococcus sp. PR-3]|uniref:GNAT family N-acetyltransferase n=1 Tax=Magnetococcus sp. PR-3 TaxID=3120355 RepID=UPI002FCE1EF3
MSLKIVQADYANTQHQRDIPYLLNLYAKDPMGGGKALSDDVLKHLVGSLAKRRDAYTVLAYIEGRAVGLLNGFEAFSTFACKPLMNIHDVFVRSDYRGQGISRQMLEKIEGIASAQGCCKLTLEVLSQNTVAKSSYQSFGFADYVLDPEAGHALFWEKPIQAPYQ